MQTTPYRIVYYLESDNQQDPSGWDFDDAEYQTPEAAYEDALKRYKTAGFRIVKLCYPTENAY